MLTSPLFVQHPRHMVSGDLRELIARMFRAIDDARWDALPEFFDANVTYERPGYPLLVGLDQVRRFYERDRVIAAGTHVLEQVVIDVDHGACWGEFAGWSKA